MQWYIDRHFNRLYKNIRLKKLATKYKQYGNNTNELIKHYDCRINLELRLLDRIFKRLRKKYED